MSTDTLNDAYQDVAVRQQQDILAGELRNEQMMIDERKQEFHNRVQNYYRVGLLSVDHLAYIRYGKEPAVKRRKQNDDAAGHSSQSLARGRTKPCPLSRKLAVTAPPNYSSEEDESSYGGGRNYEGEDEDEEFYSDTAPRYVNEEEMTEKMKSIKRLLSGWSLKSFPRQCPLCPNNFSHKRSLIRHLFGDRKSVRPATCTGLNSAVLSFPDEDDSNDTRSGGIASGNQTGSDMIHENGSGKETAVEEEVAVIVKPEVTEETDD